MWSVPTLVGLSLVCVASQALASTLARRESEHITASMAVSCAAKAPPVVDYASVPIREKPLHTPPMEEVVDVLSRGLRATFAEVAVSVADCPDLTQPPYDLAAPGLCGECKLVELGGVPYLVPLVQRSRLYDLRALLAGQGRARALLLGAGAGPWPHLGVNCEGMVNMALRDGELVQGSRVAWVEPRGAPPALAAYRVARLPPQETRAALLGNYLLSDGEPGKVIRVVANNRTGEADFITAIRESLKSHYGDRVVGLGGVFVLSGSDARYHVMPDFSEAPLGSDAAVERWLHFLPAPPPTTNVGTLVTGDMELDLRVQHFHGWGSGPGSAVGGHYHRDLCGAQARYEGLFVLAHAVLRVDAPQISHRIGRD